MICNQRILRIPGGSNHMVAAQILDSYLPALTQLLGKRDNDALRPTDVGQPVRVLEIGRAHV